MAASFCRRSFLNYKNCLFQTQKRTGYVVLIPETPEEVEDSNISSLENLPVFSKLNSKTCSLIINKLAQQYDVGLWELNQYLINEKSETLNIFKHLFEPLEILSLPFLASWGVAKMLHFSNIKNMPSKFFYPLNNKLLDVRSDKFNSNAIYTTCKKLLENDAHKYSDEEKRILEKFVLEGFLNGLELDDNNKKNLSDCSITLDSKKKLYEQKLRLAKNHFKQIISDPKFAEDSPLDLLRNTSVKWKEPLKGPWVITLNNAVFSRYLEYCPSSEACKHVWLSFNQLGSVRGEPKLNVTQEFIEIRKQRQIFAKLLGFPTYAHLAMKNKMAGSVENVQSVLSDLLENAKLAHEKEIYELEKFAYSYDFRGSLELWDLPYWSRLYAKQKFDLDELSLVNYFPLSQVLLGLIALCEQLFGIIIEDQPSAECWSSDVRYFRILDEKTKNLLGGFFLDPFAKEGKLIGETDSGWFVAMRPKSKICNSFPLSALIFSFNPPEQDKPSLLYFKDVVNLFDKFGQMLQHTLTEVTFSEVSGSTNIEWDAIGVSRHFLKLWLFERGTMESISGHYESGETLPSHILDNLCNLSRHMAGTKLCRKIYFSNLDLQLHLHNESFIKIMENLWPQHLLFRLAPMDYHPCGFEDVISGPWGSSFYSDIWSQMLAADVFSAFSEVGFSNQEEITALGRRFRSTFLALGGGCDPKEVFRRFRGRDFKTDPLKKLLNLKDPVSIENFQPEPILA